MANQILLNNVSADATSDAYESQGGEAVVNVRASSYGGGTVNIQAASPNQGTPDYVTLDEGSFTADGTKGILFLPRGMLIRAVLTGSTSPSNVFVDILQ